MCVHDPLGDEVLGLVTFDECEKEWSFNVGIDGRDVRGSIVPGDHRHPLHEQRFDEIRECVSWIRDNEPAIRDYITDQMFDGWLDRWYDEEIHATATRDGFRDAISLSGIHVLEDRVASLAYDAGELFGGHFIVLSVGAGGRFKYPPDLWG